MLHCGTSPAAGFLPPAGPKNRASAVLLGHTGERWSRWGGVSVTATRQAGPGTGDGVIKAPVLAASNTLRPNSCTLSAAITPPEP
ncbi:hypothetical protein EK904_007946 [Melospiza melodia maxima]|nr:hypothetical protein EK904_007946 [Melospiza melodia maxima]